MEVGAVEVGAVGEGGGGCEDCGCVDLLEGEIETGTWTGGTQSWDADESREERVGEVEGWAWIRS